MGSEHNGDLERPPACRIPDGPCVKWATEWAGWGQPCDRQEQAAEDQPAQGSDIRGKDRQGSRAGPGVTSIRP
ncbi:hypothetical protein DAETH_41010 (plasmid) [Deinococcus aetherius]|uniref:Uncharacterized protein n=1 Tax=Deinococcus aetherius TaxID=200252 RepID=A0ABN6RLD9_9DEIO|nr:hypothetical protein DAETH_41010 [Deinococcus aetherius]